VPSAEIGISGGFGGFHLADDLLAKAWSLIPGMMPRLLSAPQATTTWS
jgi:hypothetical protein